MKRTKTDFERNDVREAWINKRHKIKEFKELKKENQRMALKKYQTWKAMKYLFGFGLLTRRKQTSIIAQCDCCYFYFTRGFYILHHCGWKNQTDKVFRFAVKVKCLFILKSFKMRSVISISIVLSLPDQINLWKEKKSI